jgi:hypothetical protein
MFSSASTVVQQEVANEAQQQVGSSVLAELKAEIQSGNLKTALILGAVGGVVAGVAYGGLKWHQRKEKEHLRQAELVENNHTKYLTRIKVTDTEEMDLPSVFMRDAKTGMLHAAQDYKTIDELRKMVKERPSIGFSEKASDAITRAMRKLLEFYEDRLDRAWLWRGSEGDVTSAFLRYHICRLFEYGKKFQGTQYTSAVLNSIHDSLNQFSIEHGEVSERRTYLDLACRSLKTAVVSLDQQKKNRTLADLVSEATPECDELAIRLMHNLTKLVTPTQNWKYIDRCVDPKLLEEGFVKKEVEHGKPGTHPKAIMLHVSPVGENIRKVARNYNEAKGLNDEPASRVVVTNQLRVSGFTAEEQQQNFSIFVEEKKHAGLGFARWGQRLSNFMTTTSRLKNKKTESGETVPLSLETDSKDIVDRLNVLHGLTELDNDDVLIIKLFLKLKQYAKEKGDEFVANPANAQYMFDVLLSLGSGVRKQSIVCEKGLSKVERDHDLKTLTPEQAFLLTDTKQLVIAIREEVESSIKAIKNYRTETHYEMLEEEIKVHEHETLQMFADVAKERGFKLSQAIPVVPSNKKEPQPPKSGLAPSQAGSSLLEMKYANPSSHPSQGGSGATITSALTTASTVTRPPVPLRPSAILQRIPVASGPAAAAVPALMRRQPRPPVVKPEVTLAELDNILSKIHSKIIENSHEESIRPYLKVHEALGRLRTQYFNMHGDENPDRKLKARKTRDLAYEMCQFTYAYLQLPLNNRRSGFKDFNKEMEAKIHDPKSDFMDEHFGTVDRFLVDHKEGFARFFYRYSDTRKAFENVSEACHGLGKR